MAGEENTCTTHPAAATDDATSFTAFQTTTDLTISMDGLHRSSFIVVSQLPSSASSGSRSGTNTSSYSTTCARRRRSTAQPFSLPASSNTALLHVLPEPISYELHKHEHAELGYLQFRYTSVAAATRAINKYKASSSTSSSSSSSSSYKPKPNKPILLVQAEIPGDVDIGRDILSHPLLVEAAESLFVPVVEINAPHCRARTPSGKTCCTQVSFLFVSVEENEEKDQQQQQHQQVVIAPQQLTSSALVQTMVTALEQAGVTVPRYLSLLLKEQLGYEQHPSSTCNRNNVNSSKSSSTTTTTTRSRNQTARFGVIDPALAEAELAGLEGILATQVGSLERQKVVEITYDSKVLSYCALVRYALYQNLVNILYHQSNEERMVAMIEVKRLTSSRTFTCTSQNSSGGGDDDDDNNNNNNMTSAAVAVCELEDKPIQKAYDPKHALRQTPMRFVPLTPLQAVRANRLIHFGLFNEAVQLLSPRQGLILMKAMHLKAQKSFHEVVDVEMLLAWNSVCSQQHPKMLQEQTGEPVHDDSEADDDDDDDDDEECIMDTYNLCLHVGRRQSMYLPRCSREKGSIVARADLV